MGYDWRNELDDYYTSGPLPAKNGIKARNARGEISTTWWGKRWLETLNGFGLGSRLERGRAYARRGQVTSLKVNVGSVSARVQGSEVTPYRVTIQLEPFTALQWEEIFDILSEQALFSAQLLAGEMPGEIENLLEEQGLPLFPLTYRELATDCSCPDPVNPCKHIASVDYLIAEQLDSDPFLLFLLRGRDREEIVRVLRERRANELEPGTSVENAISEQPLKLEEHIADFWQAGTGLNDFVTRPEPPEIDLAVLKRLGDAPFTIEKQNLNEWLARIYKQVDRQVASRLVNEQDHEV